MNRIRQVLLLAALLTVTTGCTPEREQGELFAPGDVGVLVVDTVLIVGRNHPTVKLSRTLAPDVPFTQEAAAVTGAEISITANGRTVLYGAYPEKPGYYGPLGPEAEIMPETEYLLEVATAQEERMTASTRTPARFAVDEWTLLDPSGNTEVRRLQTFAAAGDSVYFRPENQLAYAEGLLEARFAPGGPGNFAADGYQVALFSIDMDSDYVIDPPFFEEEDFEDLARMGSSPALIAESGRVRLPWFSIYYQGRHLYKVYALDRNWYDLVRSTPQTDAGLGFGGNIGDTSDRPIFHVDGGIGLFGSAAVDSVGFFVLPGE
jgi:hypothetical protein